MDTRHIWWNFAEKTERHRFAGPWELVSDIWLRRLASGGGLLLGPVLDEELLTSDVDRIVRAYYGIT